MEKHIALVIFLLLFGSVVSINASSNLQNIPTVSIRSYNGQILGWDPPGIIFANKNDISEREFFKIHNISRPDQYPANNDIIVIQCQNGLFLGIRDDGRIGSLTDYFSSKVRFVVSGTRTNEKGDLICHLKNISTNKFLMSINGGGNELSNNATLPREFETFTIRYHEPVNVFLKTNTNDFLSVNGAGLITPIRSSTIPQRSSFSFIILNRSNKNNFGLFSRDTVLIRFRYQYVGTGSDNRMYISAERGVRNCLFVVNDQTLPPAFFNASTPITLKSVQTGKYWMASDLDLSSTPTNSSPGNSFRYHVRNEFGFESGYPSLPASITSYPMSVRLPPKTGIDSVVVFKLRLNSDFTVTDADINNKLFGPAPTLTSWLRDNSNGRYNVASKGIFGPFQIFNNWTTNGYDTLFTMAENRGINLNMFGERIWDQAKYKLLLIEPGAYWGNAGSVSGTSRRGYRFNGSVSAAGVSSDVDNGSRMVMAHEISHSLFGVTDRYPSRKPLSGDVASIYSFYAEMPTQKFIITKRIGTGQIQPGDQVSLKSSNLWVVTTINAPFYLNMVAPFTDLSWFTISSTNSQPLSHNSNIHLKAHNNKYVMALEGGNSSISATADIPREWETFTVRRTDGTSRPIISGDEVYFLTYKGYAVDAIPDGRSRPSAKDTKRGYTWQSSAGGGSGGLFDNSSANYNVVLLNLYDRIRLGWATTRYLRPEDKGTYLIRPYIGSGEGFILFDPMNPNEWYTLENRVKMANRDEIPSSGLVISWINENESYWRSIYSYNKDDDFFPGWRVNYPSVISADLPRIPPNTFYYPPLFQPGLHTRRNTQTAAFCSLYEKHEVVLPLGNGSPSRFHLIINKIRGSNDILLTIK